MSRICICSDRIGAARPLDAGRALGRAFADAASRPSQIAVVPMAAGGRDLVDALAHVGSEYEAVTATTAEDLGVALAAALARRPGRLLVDLTPLAGERADAVVRCWGAWRTATADEPSLVVGVDLVGVLPAAQASDRLLGIEGLAARHGFASGRPRADVLAADAALVELGARWGVPDAPGLGAAGGLPLFVAALGGRRTTGFELCRQAANLDATLDRADLLVAGSDAVTTGNFGGPVLLGLAPLASERGLPLLALARRVEIGARELRRHGVEAAYELGGGDDLAASGIGRAAGPVARTWLR